MSSGVATMWLDALGVGLGDVTLGVAEPLGAGGEPVGEVAVAADGVGLDAACRSWAEQPLASTATIRVSQITMFGRDDPGGTFPSIEQPSSRSASRVANHPATPTRGLEVNSCKVTPYCSILLFIELISLKFTSLGAN